MKDLIFCLLHSTFQRKKRSGWRGERDWKTATQASEHCTREKRYWQDRKEQGFQMNHFIPRQLYSFHSGMCPHWAFVLKMPWWKRSHEQATRPRESTRWMAEQSHHPALLEEDSPTWGLRDQGTIRRGSTIWGWWRPPGEKRQWDRKRANGEKHIVCSDVREHPVKV